MLRTVTDDGRKIDERGIPEGAKAGTSITYIESDGSERFRYNQGCSVAHLVRFLGRVREGLYTPELAPAATRPAACPPAVLSPVAESPNHARA